MKKSTKIALGIGTGVAFITTALITAICGKKAANGESPDCIEGECTEVENSEESTENVED